MNSAVITLIPKKETPETISDFRPISLIHSFAKLISKVLAIRLSRQIQADPYISKRFHQEAMHTRQFPLCP